MMYVYVCRILQHDILHIRIVTNDKQMAERKTPPPCVLAKVNQWSLNVQKDNEPVVFHTHSTDNIQNIVPLADGRIVFLQDGIVNLWNPTNQTLLLLPSINDDTPDIITSVIPLSNNRVLCVMPRRIRLVDFAKMMCREYVNDGYVIEGAMVLRDGRIVTRTRYHVDVMDPQSDTVQSVYESRNELSGMEEMFDGRLILYCPKQIVLCHVPKHVSM